MPNAHGVECVPAHGVECVHKEHYAVLIIFVIFF